MNLNTSIATRALTRVLGGMLFVAALSLAGVVFVLERQYDDQVVTSGRALLRSLHKESEESLAKGQRQTFQGVLDSFSQLEEVQSARLYSPAGMMTYMSGHPTVGLPFVREDDVFENPNLELFEKTRGRFARADWEMVDHVDAERAREHVQEKKTKKEQCKYCHFVIDPALGLDDKKQAWLLGGEAPIFFERIDAEGDCLTCHTNWEAGQTAGYLSITMDTHAQRAAFTQAVYGVGLTISLLLATITLLLLHVFRRQVRAPITAAAEVFRRAREERNLGVRGDESRPDEIGRMAQSFNFLMGAMRGTLGEVKDIAGVLGGASGVLRGAFSRLSDGTAQTRTRTEEAASTLDAMAGDIHEVANLSTSASDAVHGVAEDTQAISSAAEGLASETERVSSNMSEVAAAVEEMTATLQELATSGARVAEASAQTQTRREDAESKLSQLDVLTRKVAKVVDVIASVADQTSLLALNATIEAASAGEAGRGFAVVASEVKGLALQTASATEEIRGQVDAMEKAMGEVVALMSEIGERSGEVDDMTRSIAAAVEEQTATTQEISSRVHSTAQAVKSVSNNVGEISGRVSSVLESTEAVTQQVVQISFRAEELAEGAQRVRDQVSDVRTCAQRADADCGEVGHAADEMQGLVGRLEDTAGQFQT